MKHILIVDDEQIIASAIQRSILRSEMGSECNISIANNGVDAISILQKSVESGKQFDLVILDLLMPKLNGGEVLDWIQQYCPITKVIMMTAFGDPNTKNDLIQRGAKMVLLKPFEDILAFPKLIKELTD
jgi:two-component system response regulator YesN